MTNEIAHAKRRMFFYPFLSSPFFFFSFSFLSLSVAVVVSECERFTRSLADLLRYLLLLLPSIRKLWREVEAKEEAAGTSRRMTPTQKRTQTPRQSKGHQEENAQEPAQA